MIVDRRKDDYDELLILARDARMRRKRVTGWTTSLVVGGMLVSGAYVAAMNNQASALSDQHEQMRTEIGDLIEERNSLMVERDVYGNQLAKIAPASMIGDEIKKLGDKFFTDNRGQGDQTGGESTITTRYALSNVVWAVDGSRRFPMTTGDILWIPEAEVWVRLENLELAKAYRDERPMGDEAGDSFQDIGTNIPVQIPASVEDTANCIEVILHEDTLRPGFKRKGFVDMEVIYFMNGDCEQPDEDEPER